MNVQVQVVKSDSATVIVQELEFEIPMGTQKGTITTVEGMLREAGDALRALQPQRAQQDPETAAAISQFLGEYSAVSHSQLLDASAATQQSCPLYVHVEEMRGGNVQQ